MTLEAQSSHIYKEEVPDNLWENAFQMLGQEENGKKLLEDYKQIVEEQLQKKGFATVESSEKSTSSITNLRNIEDLLSSQSKKCTAGSRAREFAGHVAKAVSSITQVVSAAGSLNPYIGLACTGLCVLTAVIIRDSIYRHNLRFY